MHIKLLTSSLSQSVHYAALYHIYSLDIIIPYLFFYSHYTSAYGPRITMLIDAKTDLLYRTIRSQWTQVFELIIRYRQKPY